ncbi:MAG TPA: tellurite resistance TerB C-terminal domain-containing protein [Candidatus Obscuribacterales bacterium]
MVNNRFLVGSVAFGVSFGLSFLTNRDMGKAFSSGLITLPAALFAMVVVENRRTSQAKSTLAFLNTQIRALQRQGEDLQDLLLDLSDERQEVAAHLSSLQAQAQQAKLQLADYWNHKEELVWRLNALNAQEQHQLGQINQLQSQVKVLERQELELKRSLSSIDTLKEQAEANLATWRAELVQLETRVLEQRQQEASLDQALLLLRQQKQQLEPEVYGLQTQIQQLELRKLEVSQSLSVLQAEKQQEDTNSHPLHNAMQQLQTQVISLHKELEQLETQILERRHQKESLEEELATLNLLKLQAEAYEVQPAQPQPSNRKRKSASKKGAILPFRPPREETLPSEWTEFLLQLPMAEFQVLKAIAEQENASAAIKQIAEANIMMPELLIDSINERALDTVGDVVLEPSSSPPAIASEYLPAVKQLIKAYEDLLAE